MSNDLASFAADPAAAEVLRQLGDQRWRKARDAAKKLCKADRGRYLPLLVEANVGLALEMLGKGLVKDAETVVQYLETIAPAERVAELRTKLAAASVERPAKPEKPGNQAAGGGAEWWAVILRIDREQAAGREVPVGDWAAVDCLVPDGFVPTPGPVEEREQRIAAELAAVRKACDATGDGGWEEARAALRELPSKSVFRHWRMFLRGVRCIFEDDPGTARKCFGSLPAGGALALAADAFDPSGGTRRLSAPASARVPLLLAASGQPAAWSKPIVTAAAFWKAGRRVKAVEELHAGSKGAFPTQQPGLASALTDAILPFGTQWDDQDVELPTTFFGKIAPRPGKRSASDAMLAVLRPLCVMDAGEAGEAGDLDGVEAAELEESWRSVLHLWAECEGPDRLRESVAWQWLGEELAKSGPASVDYFYPRGQGRRNGRRAQQMLEKAVDCDPENEAAWLSLLELLADTDGKAHDRLLGEVAKRFPNSKKILAQAGEHAVARKAHVKGLAALNAALALDPLDKRVKCSVLVALVDQTRAYLRKGRPVAGQWAAMEPLLEDRPDHDDFMLARWGSRVRQGLLDPEPASAQRAREDAKRLAPSDVERLFLEKAMALAYKIKAQDEWGNEWRKTMAAGSINWGIFSRLLELLSFASAINARRAKAWKQITSILFEVLGSLLDHDMKKDLDGLLVFIDRFQSLRRDLDEPASRVLNACIHNIEHVSDLAINRSRNARKLDPRLRLANLMVLDFTESYLHVDKDVFFQKMAHVEADARRLGMDEVATRANALRLQIEERESKYDRDGPFGGADDDVEDDDFDVDDGPPSEVMGVVELMGQVAEYIAAVAAGDKRAAASAEGKLAALGISGEALAEVIEMAESEGMLPPQPTNGKGRKPAAPPPEPKSRKPRVPPFDPNQPSLFD